MSSACAQSPLFHQIFIYSMISLTELKKLILSTCREYNNRGIILVFTEYEENFRELNSIEIDSITDFLRLNKYKLNNIVGLDFSNIDLSKFNEDNINLIIDIPVILNNIEYVNLNNCCLDKLSSNRQIFYDLLDNLFGLIRKINLNNNKLGEISNDCWHHLVSFVVESKVCEMLFMDYNNLDYMSNDVNKTINLNKLKNIKIHSIDKSMSLS